MYAIIWYILAIDQEYFKKEIDFPKKKTIYEIFGKNRIEII